MTDYATRSRYAAPPAAQTRVPKAAPMPPHRTLPLLLAALLTAAAAPAFLDTPNHPLAEPLPVIAGHPLGDGLVLAPGGTAAFTLTMGTDRAGATMATAQSIRDRFFLNYMTGDLHRALGSPMDTGQANNGTFAAVARHTQPGVPGDLHTMEPDGMHLRARCDPATGCTPGHVWAAMVRLPFEWRPGTVLKVRYRSPPGPHSWAPIWMFTGQQASPGPGGNPYAGWGGPDPLYRQSRTLYEIDWNDNFPRLAAGVPTGFQLDFGTPDIYGTRWTAGPPRDVFRATAGGWRAYGPEFNPAFLRTPFDWSRGFHDLVGSWRDDGTNRIDVFVDGTLVASNTMEYHPDTYTDPATGTTKTVALHLIIGNQAIPSFSPGASWAIDNDGLPEGWTIVVQEVSGWYGTVADPDSHRPR